MIIERQKKFAVRYFMLLYPFKHPHKHTYTHTHKHTEPNYRFRYAVIIQDICTCVYIRNIEFVIYFVQAWKAFGNYLDLLKEVTFSPLMCEYLSFLRNSAFDHDQNYPDENYAREVYLRDGRRLEGFVLTFIGMM